MKVFLIDNNKIIKYMMPSRIDDSFLITYKSSSIKNCIITFDGINNYWYLKSNGIVDIIESGEVLESVKIEIYKKYTLRIVETKTIIELYFLPSKEKLYKLSFNKLNSFSVGSNGSSNISYNSPLLADIEAIFKLVGGDWVISTVNDNNYPVFINNYKVTLKKMKAGDIIFLGGLKIVWMSSFIYVNNPCNSLKVMGMYLIEDAQKLPVELLPVKEEDKYTELYDKNDYFVHYPSIREKIATSEITVDAPPSEDKDGSLPYILRMGSSFIMIASSFMMGYNVVNGLMGGKKLLEVLPQLIMCGSMIIGSIIFPKITASYQKKKKKKREKLRQEKYTEYLQSKNRELQLMIKNELRILEDNYLNTANCLTALNKKNKNFWWRQFKDEEFLSIRLGIGRVPTNIIVKAPERHFTLDEDNLLEDSYKIKDNYQYVDGAPITISLISNPITSIICDNENKNNYINEIIAQLITLHSSLDLKVILITNQENSDRWEFIKYIPHIFSEDKTIRFFATNEDEAKYISNYLEEVLKSRKEQFEDPKNLIPIPYYLIITDDYKNNSSIQIIEEILNKDARNYGFSLLIADNSIKQVPSNGDAFIEVGLKDGVIIENKEGLNSQKVFYLDNLIKDLDMQALANKLADVPVLTKNGETGLPDSVKFLDMFNVSKIEQLNILNRWQTNNPVVSLDTVVGVKPSGDKFKLDLHEKYHGPHGLIAGSTGSGKSEFIITYILSLAINYHPYEVQFVLIDYKGGGLAGAFENKETGIKIPHLVGTITNLDTNEMNRSLVSIQSELTRRQKIFNEVRESLGESTIDIYKYQRLYREGIVKRPMAHLFIICDEFAELKQQQPEFMQQLISTSRIGRSLGVHLILATQKPSGVVNDQIWANSKFKVCLKVQDKSDSMEMLKRPEAASLKETGRFYLQVGYDELFEIGQSGWSGAKYCPSDKIKMPVDESINFINNVGFAIKNVKEEISNKDNKDYGDQLTNLVKYIYQIGKKEKIITRKLWLDAIPENIFINDLKKKYNYIPEKYYINPVIGEYDDPENQFQNILCVDLSKKGNLLIYGIPGSGKEDLLTCLIRSTIVEHTPEEVNIYILDCGSESMKIFANFPHVGDVVTIDDSEKIKDLIKMSTDEIERRKSIFAEYAGSYNDYILNSGNKLPLLLIVINNYDVFVENYANESESLQSLFRDGYKYGVVFVVSAISQTAIKMRTVTFFNNKICLKLSNPGDYRQILNSSKDLIPADIFGRGITLVNGRSYEFQTAMFAEKKDFTNSLRELSKSLNSVYLTKAKPIPSIPQVVDVDLLSKMVKGIDSIPIGYDYFDKNVSYYSFNNNKVIPISFNSYDEVNTKFLEALYKLLSQKANVTILDFSRKIKSDGLIKIIDNDFDKAIAGIKFDFDSTLKETQPSYLIICGLNQAKNYISDDTYKILESLLNTLNQNPSYFVILFDNISGFREIKNEPWYLKNSEQGSYIWLGEGLFNQITFSQPNISFENKKINFEYIAYIVKNEKCQIIKHVVNLKEEYLEK